MKLLLQILGYKRPYLSNEEEALIEKVLDPISGMRADKFGNRIIEIKESDGKKPTVMFSSHTDTVHRKPGMQNIYIDPLAKEIRKYDGECLGADDGSGMWVMINMINHKVPGLYIFHRGEEVGGLGSSWIVNNTPRIVRKIKIAIAFDRRRNTSIITHQAGGKCCSNEFALSFAKQLNMDHTCDTGGTFTDTANYTDIIQECTNLSIGYTSEHSRSEKQDYGYLFELRKALLKVDWSKLEVKRDTSDNSSAYQSSGYRGRYGHHNSFGNFGANDYDADYEYGAAHANRRSAQNSPNYGGSIGAGRQVVTSPSTNPHSDKSKGTKPRIERLLDHSQAYDLCLHFPSIAADLLINYTVTDVEVEEAKQLFGFDNDIVEA